MATEIKTQVPKAPAILPASLQKKWTETFTAALKQAQGDHPDDVPAQTASALREANRMLRVPEPESYEDAKRLAEWQVLLRRESEGQLKITTIDGRKYAFEIPSAKSSERAGVW
jgi:hypothetical protein